MKLYIVAGFDDMIGAKDLALIESLGFAGVRRDVRPANANKFCSEFVDTRLSPLFLVAGGKMTEQGSPLGPPEIAERAAQVARVVSDLGLFDTHSAAIEIGNEPDISNEFYKESPDRFAEAVAESSRRVREVSPGATVVAGGVSNTHKRGLDYIRRAIDAGLPSDVCLGYHSYHTTVAAKVAHPGFSSRDEELRELRVLASGRPLWCTECGWHTAPSFVRAGFLGLFRKRVQFSDTEVAEFTDQEMSLHDTHGAEVFTLFQMNDGPDPNAYEHRFGIRHSSGDLKPIAGRIQRYSQLVVGREGRRTT